MKYSWFKTAVVSFAVTAFAWTSQAESSSFDVHTRVGDGWHMYTTVTLSDSGQIKGATRLENYNNFLGFTGGVFAVALDERNEAIYATEIHSFGINSAFFKKVVKRNVTWTDTIPAEYLSRVDKVAVVQVHNPTYRVWTWIYNNREILIQHGKAVADLYKKYKNNELTPGDIESIIKMHLSKI